MGKRLAVLRSGRSLEYALEASQPPANVFRESLFAAKQQLQRARGAMTTGYDGTEELLRIAP